MNIFNFNSLNDLKLYRAKLAIEVYELEEVIRKRRRNGGDIELDSLRVDGLKKILSEINDWLYYMNEKRNMSNGECLNVLLSVLNKDANRYSVKFYNLEKISKVYIVSNDRDITNREFITYDICSVIHNKGDYLDSDSYLKDDYEGMSEEDMDKVNEYMFDRLKKSGKVIVRKKK